MTCPRTLTVALVLLLGAACSDGDATPASSPDAALAPSAPESDAAALLPSDAAAVDAGSTPGAAAIPLIDWVDDLVDHHSTETSAPDTVHDKNIVDDEAPAQFDKYFQARP